jgi:phosphoserine phosphatase
MSKIRIVASMPIPSTLVEFGPFEDASIGDFKISNNFDATPENIAKVKNGCQAAFKENKTAGYCLIEEVQAVFFDMDSTVIKEESIVALGEAVGKSEVISAVTERAMAGELDFSEALRERVALLKGITEEQLVGISSGLTLNDGILEFADHCRAKNVPVFLISGGFMQLAADINMRVGFADYYANLLELKDGALTGLTSGAVVDGQMKQTWLKRKCRELGIDLKNVAAVGDGANDIPMMEVAGTSIGFNPKPILHSYIDSLNSVCDHRMLIPLLFSQ